MKDFFKKKDNMMIILVIEILIVLLVLVLIFAPPTGGKEIEYKNIKMQMPFEVADRYSRHYGGAVSETFYSKQFNPNYPSRVIKSVYIKCTNSGKDVFNEQREFYKDRNSSLNRAFGDLNISSASSFYAYKNKNPETYTAFIYSDDKGLMWEFEFTDMSETEVVKSLNSVVVQ